METSLDLILLAKAAVMGIVEGLTEFLPISSTGHLILAGSLLGFSDDKSKVFDIAIQTGAILAVVIVYWSRLAGAVAHVGDRPAARRFLLNVLIGFLPAAVIGLIAYKAIMGAAKMHIFTTSGVGVTIAATMKITKIE